MQITVEAVTDHDDPTDPCMSWELRVFDGKEMAPVAGPLFYDESLAVKAYEQQIRIMPNCPCDLVCRILIRSHLT